MRTELLLLEKRIKKLEQERDELRAKVEAVDKFKKSLEGNMMCMPDGYMTIINDNFWDLLYKPPPANSKED